MVYKCKDYIIPGQKNLFETGFFFFLLFPQQDLIKVDFFVGLVVGNGAVLFVKVAPDFLWVLHTVYTKKSMVTPERPLLHSFFFLTDGMDEFSLILMGMVILGGG